MLLVFIYNTDAIPIYCISTRNVISSGKIETASIFSKCIGILFVSDEVANANPYADADADADPL